MSGNEYRVLRVLLLDSSGERGESGKKFLQTLSTRKDKVRRVGVPSLSNLWVALVDLLYRHPFKFAKVELAQLS